LIFEHSKTHAVRVDAVTKKFGGHCAVDGLSLAVPRGGVYGFIGPNGSGKTTTLRMIMNLIFPDTGTIEVLGRRSSSAARDRVSYLPEERGLYKKMTVRGVLRYYGLLKGADPATVEASLSKWLERLDLGAWAGKKVEELSKGMAQKVQFISALVSEPELLILDEPFSGLDPVNAHEMKKVLGEIKAAGGTVILSTHDMAAAEILCDRIGMIFHGRKVLDGTLAEIQAQYTDDAVSVRTDKSLGFLGGLAGVVSAEALGGDQVLRLNEDPQKFLKLLAASAEVRHFEILKPSLNAIFLKLALPPRESHVPA
jgi:ABC-2 type transport system ATP-binding protein